MPTALIYAYKTRDAEKYRINPDSIRLAYQVSQPLAPFQCDFGKDFTAHLLKKFKEEGGAIKVINSGEELVLPLAEEKILVPVPKDLLDDWELSDLL